MSAYRSASSLVRERRQLDVDIGCGMGSAGRLAAESRIAEIDFELGQREQRDARQEILPARRCSVAQRPSDSTANVISEAIGSLLAERRLYIVKPQAPTMGEIALEAYGHGRACDAVALEGEDLQALLSEIGVRCVAIIDQEAGDRGEVVQG